ncbi:DUF2812 domain-containing protein [uncultured Paenibacillus sp.]|uniref:DUF2812 domain-containing protein n=1 Tax=uncultured Paenibacillus sp. TaxID=227322 RepID=UPI0015B3714D|nr:DUF2812 domain-containing protein [uncultured Paenibacillus sp.]
MRQIKFFIDFEKEEQWLNGMAKRGFALAGKSIAYVFDRAEPEDAVIKIDFRQFKSRADFEDYLALFEDSGWKHVAGSKSSGSQYFRKVDETVSDDIFSDADSRAGRYQRLSRMWFSLACCYIPIFAAMVSTGLVDTTAFTDPKALYYTPGLWEKTGVSFWQAFLFETPFALGRGFAWLIFPLLIGLYLIFSALAKSRYRQVKS